MKIKQYLLLIIYFPLLLSCSGNNPNDQIDLNSEMRLESTDAGWWIRELNLDYGAADLPLTQVMHDTLLESAVAVEKIQSSDDRITVIWESCTPNCIIIEENVTRTSDSENIWFEYNYAAPGVPCSDILPPNFELVETNDVEGQVAVIRSTKDMARLFIFGSGVYCRSMSIL